MFRELIKSMWQESQCYLGLGGSGLLTSKLFVYSEHPHILRAHDAFPFRRPMARDGVSNDTYYQAKMVWCLLCEGGECPRASYRSDACQNPITTKGPTKHVVRPDAIGGNATRAYPMAREHVAELVRRCISRHDGPSGIPNP